MIAFPTTPEAFIAYQESGIHRKLDDFEREFADVVVELINGSYKEGLNGEENTITMKSVKKYYKEHGGSPDSVIRIWKSICWWCDKAYMAGKEAKSV